MNKLIIAILIVLLFLLKKYNIIKLDWYTILIFVFIIALLMTGNNNDNNGNFEHFGIGKGLIDSGDLHIKGSLTVDGNIINKGDLIFKNADVNKWILTSPTGDDILYHRPWDPVGKSWSAQKQNAMRLNGNFRIDGGGINMGDAGFVNAGGGITTTGLTVNGLTNINGLFYANQNLCINKNWWFHTPEGYKGADGLGVPATDSNLYIGHSGTSSGGDWPSGSWSQVIHKDGGLEVPGILEAGKRINAHDGIGIHAGDLRINKDLYVDGISRLGNWQIRNDKIGIEGKGDLNFGADNWLRLTNYDAVGIDANLLPNRGFACDRLWASKDATVNNWKIRDSAIGIEGRADMHLAADKWLRLYNYGTGEYAGADGTGGFAGYNIWNIKRGLIGN